LAFNVSFKDPHRVVTALLSHMSSCRDEWNKDSDEVGLYAAYFAVVQGSMMGKTRLFFTLPQSGVYVFYICLRDPKSTGFPGCIPALMTALTSPRCTEGFYAAFVLASLERLSEFRNARPAASSAEFFDEEQADPSFWTPILGKATSLCR
jgi:hypothetical protein